EAAWFEMGPHGLSEVDPGRYLSPGGGAPGSATALLLAGRRALAVEIQALVLSGEGPPRRHATGIDVRRFSLVAAVLDQVAGVRAVYAPAGVAAQPGVAVTTVAHIRDALRWARPPPGRAAYPGSDGE